MSADIVDLPGGFGRIRECRHGRMIFNPHDVYVGRSLDVYGEYSEAEAAFLRFIVRPGDTVVEAGANIGALTVVLAQAAGPTGWVVAYEPQRIAFQMLCTNIMLGGFANVEARPTAAGAEPGSITVPQLDPTKPNNFGGLELGGAHPGLTVAVETIDALELPRCRLIKADVEGMESAVLAGAAQTIARHRPFLYLENDRRDHSPALIRHVLSLGYRAWWHLPVYYNPQNFRAVAENLFPGEGAFNILCAPREINISVSAQEIQAEDSWPVP
jgi:methyltransferase, FkbM family